MKNSIKNKLFLLFALFMVAFILCGVFINVLFLEQFYVLKNKDIFIKINTQVKNNLNLNKDDFINLIESIDRSDGVSIAVANHALDIKFSSYGSKKSDGAGKVPKEVESAINENLDKSIIYIVTEKSGDGAPKLSFISKQQNGDFIILSKPMKGIRESAEISVQFYMLAGIFIIIIGSFAMFSFAKKISKPIVKMSGVAEDISNLNFENKVHVSSKDEIGELGQSINTISEKLKVSIEGLREDIEHQKELARNTSHELKTPIGVIKGYTEGLLYGVANNQQTKDEYLKVIINECDRMDHMVKELLDLSTLQAKNATLGKVSDFTATSLINSVLERFELIMKEQGIKCLTECPDSMMLNGDYELLERAVGNIIMNAVKYNDENKYIKVSAKEQDGKKMISVFNTGVPIPEKDLENIFEVFFKADKARSRKTGGHGLGLSIVKSIINLHGGEVFAYNKKGGVEFNIILK